MDHPDPAAWGIVLRHQLAAGDWREVQPAVVAALLEAMGADTERPPDVAGLRFHRAGASLRSEVRLEDGARLPAGRPVPPGYHRLGDALLVSSPGVCPLPEGRRWGFAAQLYA